MEVRRTVSEWITRLELGSSTKFVFCEGPLDQRLLAELLGDAVEIRVTNDVHVEIDDDASPYLSGNRRRLVAFAGELALAGVLNARVLVDNDMGTLDPTPPFAANCIRTDFANLPATFIDQQIISTTLARLVGNPLDHPEWETLCSGLRLLFASRKFRYDNYPRVSPPAPGEVITCNKTVPVLAFPEYLRRLKAAGVGEDEAELTVQIEEIASAFVEADPRSYFYSEDFAELLFRILRCSRKISAGYRAEHLWAVVVAGFVLQLDGSPRLQQLAEWANAERTIN